MNVELFNAFVAALYQVGVKAGLDLAELQSALQERDAMIQYLRDGGEPREVDTPAT